MARRFGRINSNEWGKMEVREEILRGNFRKRSGRVMFPSTHDIFSISPFKEACFDLRGTIEIIKLNVKILKADSQNGITGSLEHPIDLSEILANLQLAYRHLEDARMRLGKAIQAYDGGQSCYPR